MGQRVANSPIVGVEPEKVDAGYNPRVLAAPASTAHGHGRVSAADYLIQCRYDHASKNYGPGWRCRQGWRPLRGPANTRPDYLLAVIDPVLGVAGPLSQSPCEGELPSSAQRELSTPVTERFSIPLSHSMRRRRIALGEARRAADAIADRVGRQSELG